jgi:hypothetical protein
LIFVAGALAQQYEYQVVFPSLPDIDDTASIMTFIEGVFDGYSSSIDPDSDVTFMANVTDDAINLIEDIITAYNDYENNSYALCLSDGIAAFRAAMTLVEVIAD